MSASDGTATRVRGGPRHARRAATEERVLERLGELVPGVLGVAILIAIAWALWGKW